MLRLFTLFTFILLAGCSMATPEATEPSSHGEAVQGLALRLEVVAVPTGGHFVAYDVVNTDTGLENQRVHWPRLFRLTFINLDDKAKVITLGFNVHAEPSMEDDVVLRFVEVESGHTIQVEAGAMSIWGSFERTKIPLPAGGRYAILLRRGAPFLNHDDDDVAPKDFQVSADYVAGFVKYIDNRGKRKLVTDPVRSNVITVTRAATPPQVIRVFEEDAKPTPMTERWPGLAN